MYIGCSYAFHNNHGKSYLFNIALSINLIKYSTSVSKDYSLHQKNYMYTMQTMIDDDVCRNVHIHSYICCSKYQALTWYNIRYNKDYIQSPWILHLAHFDLRNIIIGVLTYLQVSHYLMLQSQVQPRLNDTYIIQMCK